MGDIGKPVNWIVQFLKTGALANIELDFFEKVHREVDGEELRQVCECFYVLDWIELVHVDLDFCRGPNVIQTSAIFNNFFS